MEEKKNVLENGSGIHHYRRDQKKKMSQTARRINER